MQLKGKTALITGGAIRLGKAITLALAQEGCDVFIHYNRSIAPAQQIQSEASAFGVRAEIGAADFANTSEIVPLMDAAAAAFGTVDILINSAAVYFPGRLAETTQENWDTQFQINLKAPFLLCQAFAAQLPAACPGKIINITDARSFRPNPDHFAYRLTKAALLAMTEILAKDLAPSITVNAVALGMVLPVEGKDDAYASRFAEARVPLKRIGSPQIVAENILHLLHQDFITGTILKVDGGEFL